MRTILRFLATAVVMIVLGSAALQAQNVVIDWNNIASTTIITNAKQSSTGSAIWFAYVQLAVYDAVNAITGQYRPFYYRGAAPRQASVAG